jgi:hypothetical protein
MLYDQAGRFLRPELAGASRPYQQMLAAGLRHCIPLLGYLTTHEPRLMA